MSLVYPAVSSSAGPFGMRSRRQTGKVEARLCSIRNPSVVSSVFELGSRILAHYLACSVSQATQTKNKTRIANLPYREGRYFFQKRRPRTLKTMNTLRRKTKDGTGTSWDIYALSTIQPQRLAHNKKRKERTMARIS